MDRDTAVRMAQDAIKAKNKRLVDAVLKIKTEREQNPQPPKSINELPLIAVTCSTGWECYAVVEELAKTLKYRVRALYRTPGTQAAERLERLLEQTEAEHPGLLTLHSGMDMTSAEQLTEGFRDCDGVVLYCTANTAKAGKITNHGNDPVNGRIAFMKQVTASLAALKANPSVQQVITLVFPTDKVTGIADDTPEIPWWMHQRLLFSDFLHAQGVNVTCIHRPAYYYGLHRVDYTRAVQQRGKSAMSKNMIKENNMPGINDPDVHGELGGRARRRQVVRHRVRIPGGLLEPELLHCLVRDDRRRGGRDRRAHEPTRHEVCRYKPFPQWVMKMICLFTEEVVYPLRYSQWYNDKGNGYDFDSNDDLADLEKIHPRWTFEKKLEDWGITEIKPAQK